MSEIRVDITIAELPKGWTQDYQIYSDYINQRLREAGIPLSPEGWGFVTSGELHRLDSEVSFGKVTYVWKPDG